MPCSPLPWVQKPAMKNKPKAATQSGEIRIIAGQWRGRRLKFTAQEGLRPTLDRFRETLFNWLAFDIAGARCLDLFAGSGALGLEALSRGAAHVDFIDASQSASQAIKRHLQTLNCRQASVYHSKAETWLKQQSILHATPTPYQIIFLDPPFHRDLLQPCFYLLEQHGFLAKGCLIYLEAESDFKPATLPPQWHISKEKITRNKIFLLLKYASSPSD